MKKRTFFYDFKNCIDFDLPSRRKLEKRLGDYDVLAEYTICAVRDMGHSIKGNASKKEFFKEKLRLHKVNMSGYVEYPNKEHDLCMLFMVNTNAMLNDYIDSYAKDIRALINPDFEMPGDNAMSKVEKLLFALKKNNIEFTIPVWVLQCLNYYRLVRNNIAHNDGEQRQCKEAYEGIDKKALNNDYPIFIGKAPNPIENICMNDFYFYSACVKHFANYTVMALKGKVNWSEIGAIHPLFRLENIPFGTNPKTWINRVLNDYHCKATKQDRDAIYEVIKARKNKR